MEDRVDTRRPGSGDSEVKCDRVDNFFNGEGAITMWGQFRRGVGSSEIFAIKPHKVPN